MATTDKILDKTKGVYILKETDVFISGRVITDLQELKELEEELKQPNNTNSDTPDQNE